MLSKDHLEEKIRSGVMVKNDIYHAERVSESDSYIALLYGEYLTNLPSKESNQRGLEILKRVSDGGGAIDLYRYGVGLERLGHYAEAMEAFKRSHNLSYTPAGRRVARLMISSGSTGWKRYLLSSAKSFHIASLYDTAKLAIIGKFGIFFIPAGVVSIIPILVFAMIYYALYPDSEKTDL